MRLPGLQNVVLRPRGGRRLRRLRPCNWPRFLLRSAYPGKYTQGQRRRGVIAMTVPREQMYPAERSARRGARRDEILPAGALPIQANRRAEMQACSTEGYQDTPEP